MNISSNELFKVLSLRRPLSLGKTPSPPDESIISRRQEIINTQLSEQPEDEEGLTGLQEAKQNRAKLLKQIDDVKAIRKKLVINYEKRLKDAYEEYEKKIPLKGKLLLDEAKPGVLKKVSTFLLGKKLTSIELKKHDSFLPPMIDQSFIDEVEESLSGDQKQILNSVKSELQTIPYNVSEGPSWSLESSETVFQNTLQEMLDKANNACHKIHVWEEEVRLQDTTAKPKQVTTGNRPSIKAIGFGDLIVARERLVGYDAREIAHIENVLPGEERLREHELMTKREVMTETETMEETRSQKHLETTDRFELETQSQKVINTEMKLEAGVNTSGKYGLTTVETSLEGGLSRSQEESQSATSKLARETVSRAVQEVHKSARELRRITMTEQVKELNRHGLSRKDKDNGYSGIYYWVEKICEIELRHYGTRLMLEFFIPEPALSLLPQNAQTTQQFKKPAPLSFGPEDIGEDNFRCLAALYSAVDVIPPPPDEIQVGYAWASTPNEAAGTPGQLGFGQETKQDYIPIPEGYVPIKSWIAVTGYSGFYGGDDPESRRLDIFVSIAGSGTQFYSTWETYGPIDIKHTIVAPEGLPLTIRASALYDQTGTVNINVLCKRTDAWLHTWQLRTFERIREAHAVMVSDYERQIARAQIQGGIEIKGRHPAENRVRETEELTKWAIKTMRIVPFNFNAVVRQRKREEIDPVLSDAYAPIMRFFQDAFEWRQMSYILYPYYWGRRDSYGYRNNLTDPDPLHQAFLRAGAARVIVPVTPGFEERVLHYLDTQDETDEIARVDWLPLNMTHEEATDELWLEVLINKNEEMARGSGTLSVETASPIVSINEDSKWVPSERDIGRELIIGGDSYSITAFEVEKGDDHEYTKRDITIEPAYKLESNERAVYATGSVLVGQSWKVRVPTSLVVLAEEKHKLLKDIDYKKTLEPNEVSSHGLE